MELLVDFMAASSPSISPFSLARLADPGPSQFNQIPVGHDDVPVLDQNPAGCVTLTYSWNDLIASTGLATPRDAACASAGGPALDHESYSRPCKISVTVDAFGKIFVTVCAV